MFYIIMASVLFVIAGLNTAIAAANEFAPSNLGVAVMCFGVAQLMLTMFIVDELRQR